MSTLSDTVLKPRRYTSSNDYTYSSHRKMDRSRRERISKVTRSGDCWIWNGRRDRNGYGITSVGGKTMTAHRWMYEQFVGHIPVGLQLDHLCRNRSCVSPAHLEPVTVLENRRRALAARGVGAHLAVCKRGHAMTPENTMVRVAPNRAGSHECRTCRRERDQLRYLRRTEEVS